jgi:hypothetical protein
MLLRHLQPVQSKTKDSLALLSRVAFLVDQLMRHGELQTALRVLGA